MLVYKGTDLCRIYKGSVLISDACAIILPKIPTNLICNVLDLGPQPPIAPSNINLTLISIQTTAPVLDSDSVTDTSFRVFWTPAVHTGLTEQSYHVYINDVFTAGGLVYSMVFNGMVNCSTYNVKVVCVFSDDSESNFSNLEVVNTICVLPDIPTNISLGIYTVQNPGKVVLSTLSEGGITWVGQWTNPIVGDYPVASYKLWLNGVHHSTINDPTANQGTWTGLTYDTSFTLHVSVVDTEGNESLLSNSLLILTQSAPIILPDTPTNIDLNFFLAPATPTNITVEVTNAAPTVGTLTIDSYGSDSVIITCPFSTPGGFSKWSLWINGGIWGDYLDNPINGKYIGSMNPGNNSLQVQVFDVYGVSVWSNTASVWLGIAKIPTNINLVEISETVIDPSNLITTSETTTSIGIDWDPCTPLGIESYIEYRVNGTSYWDIVTLNNSTSVYEIIGLTPDTNYQIRVRSQIEGGNFTNYTNTITHATDVLPVSITAPTAPTSWSYITPGTYFINAGFSGAIPGDGVPIAGYNLYVNGDFDHFVSTAGSVAFLDKQGLTYLVFGSHHTIEVETVGEDGQVSPTRLIENDVYTLFYPLDDRPAGITLTAYRCFADVNGGATLEMKEDYYTSYKWFWEGSPQNVLSTAKAPYFNGSILNTSTGTMVCETTSTGGTFQFKQLIVVESCI